MQYSSTLDEQLHHIILVQMVHCKDTSTYILRIPSELILLGMI